MTSNTTFFKRIGVAALAVFMSTSLLMASDAQAKRLGGGGSKGKQSSNVSNRTQAQPEAPKSPSAAAPTAGQAAPAAAGAATAGAAAKAAPAAAAASNKSKWLGPIAGLAAGLGLGWLASSLLGSGGGFGGILMMVLLAVAAFFVIRMIMARRSSGSASASGHQPAYSAPGASPYSAPSEPAALQAPAMGRSGSMIGSAIGAGVASTAEAQAMAASDSSWRIPTEMNVESFLAGAKSQYVELQAAYDRGDLDELHGFVTQEMYKEIAQDVTARGGRGNQTQVISLNAGLLGVETTAHEHIASVRFTGQVNEDGSVEAIDEVWNLTKPVSGLGGWLLAGIQQY